MRAVVCMPTYNERDNLTPLVEEVLKTVDADILIIDDSSPDGTGKTAELLAERESRLSVLHRPTRDGLGRAYMQGFREALDRGYELILQMDADLSHQPRYLPLLLEGLRDTDVVLGSRYADGGGIQNWGLPRRILSKVSNAYAGTILRMPYRDITTGYCGYRRHVLEAVDVPSLQSDGRGFQVELKYRAHRLGFSFVEVPIQFWDRVSGASKMDTRTIVGTAKRVLELRFGGGQ